MLTHRDLSVICQTGHPALQASKVKLPLFNGAVMKPVGEVALDVQKVGQSPQVLKFQVTDMDSRPLLFAETCETLELLKINWIPTPQVKSICENQTNLTKEKILQDYKDVFEGLGNLEKQASQLTRKSRQYITHPDALQSRFTKTLKLSTEKLSQP